MATFSQLGPALTVTGGGAASATTASVSPNAARTQFVYVQNYNVSGAANPPEPTSVAGAGLTFALVGASWISGPGGGSFGEVRGSLWMVSGGTAGTGGITITCPGGSSCVFGGLMFEIDVLGLSARQVKLGNTSPGTSTTVSATTTTATLGGSSMIGCWFNYSNDTTTANWSTGWNVRDTSLGDWGVSFNSGGSDTGSITDTIGASQISIFVVELSTGAPSFVPDVDAGYVPQRMMAAPRWNTPRGLLVDSADVGAVLKNFKLESPDPWPLPWLRAWTPPARPPRVVLFEVPELAPAAAAPFVVASQQTQGTAAFSPSTLTFTCAAGDALIFVAGWWNFYHDSNAPAGGAAPTDSNGTVADLYDQWVPEGVASNSPPVYAQSWIVENCAAGSHVITAPSMHGDFGVDGTFYVVQVRGLKTSRSLRLTGSQRSTVGSHQTGNTVALSSACQTGDFVLAFSTYDNTTPFGPPAGYTDPPSGWTSAGVQQGSDSNVPSELAWRLAPAADTESVSWTWSDTGVNVTAATVLAFVPLSAPDTLAAGIFTDTGQAALFQAQMVAAAGATADTGQAATFTASLAAAAGGTTEAGQGASFQTALIAAGATFAETGGAAGGQTQLVAGAGGTTDAGQDAAFQVAMAAGAGSTADLGEDAAFQAQLVAAAGGTVDTFADAGGVMATIGPSAGGTFAESGQAATFTTVLAAAAGGTVDTFAPATSSGGSTSDGATFTESGQPATFTTIMPAAGSGTADTGQAAAFRAVMAADAGGTVDAGQDAPGVVVLLAQGGVYTETFSPATDVHPPLPTVDYRADVVDLGPRYPVTVVDLGPRYRVAIKEIL